jgi:hypothetical protein
MEPTSSVATEPKPQAEARAPQSQTQPQQTPPDSEARYQRRAAFLGNPRTFSCGVTSRVTSRPTMRRLTGM